MNYPSFALKALVLGLLAPHLNASILVNLDPTLAIYNGGVVNDAGAAGSQSGIPTITNYATGFTFNIEFTPVASDLVGTKLLIEIGGTSNGSGLYLVEGVPTFIGKQGSNDATVPSSLNDTSLNAIAVQSRLGKLEAGTAYSVSVSWNHAGALELVAEAAGASPLLDAFAISGTPGNWVGNNTLSVKTFSKANAGGLSGNNAANVLGPPFDVDNAASLAGVVTRALFWTASSVTPLAPTAPVVKGFSATRLPVAGKVRFHWDVTEGGSPDPTTAITITDSGNPAVTIPVPATLTGYQDVTLSGTNFLLTATNATGSTTAAYTLEQDTPYSSVVRAANPVAWYRFNEATGSQHLVDSAENAAPFDGTLLGTSVAGGTGFIDHAGVFEGGSALIGGSIINPGTLVPVPADPPVARNGFTIEAIVKRRTGINSNHVLVSQTDQDGTGRVILGIQEDGTIYSQLGGGPAQKKVADSKLPSGVWSHLVLVVDPGTTTTGTAEFRWYLDGKKISSTLDGVNPDGSTFNPDFVLEASSGKWVLGSAKTLGSEFWKGDIDEIAIYPKLLDDPDGNGDIADSLIGQHRDAWYAETSGIVRFDAASSSVVTGGSTQLFIQTGPDVDAISINNGVGSVPLVNGGATVTVSPTATTTYQLTATGPGGASYTADYTITYNQLTVPVVYGYEATTLPATTEPVAPERVRLHWKLTAGDFPTPVTVRLKSGGNLLHETTDLQGYWDWTTTAASAVDLTIEATNIAGTSTWTAQAPALDTPYSATIRAANPVAWFRFNEGAGSGLIVDSANNAKPHNGTLQVGPAVNNNSTGFLDGAGAFNQSSGIVTDEIIDIAEIERGFSIEAIIRNEPGNNGTNRAIITQQDLNGTGRQILTVDDNGYVRANLGAGVAKASDGRVPGRTWTHVVAVADAGSETTPTPQIRWYIDGVFAGTSEDDRLPDGSTPANNFEVTKGAWVIGANKALDGTFWKGQIDDIVVYDKLLDNPDGNDATNDSLVKTHRDAWWGETSGILFAGASATTINAGDGLFLTLKVGAGSTVEIDNGVGPVTVDGGNAVIPLNPLVTTTYTITVNGPGGPYVQTITVTVNGSAVPLEILSHRIENGNFILNFRGAPSTTYAVKGSTTLNGFPIDHGTAPTDASGAGTATIPIDPLKTSEFYRIELPQ